MDTRQALIKHLALDLLHEYGLAQQGWTFQWDSAKRRAGACNYQTRTISGSRYILPMATDEEVRETLLHEIAHALTPGHSHGAVWRRKLIEIGGTGARTHRMETVKGRYDVMCENCGVVGNRHQRQGSWKVATRENRMYRHSCGGTAWLQDRTTAPAPVQAVRVPVAASEARETPTEGPECTCGCGGRTKGGRYLPGHDAKHVAWQAAMVQSAHITPEQALAELPSPALHNKLAQRLHKMGWTFDADTRTWDRV